MSSRRSNRVAEYSAVVASFVAGGAAAFAPSSPTERPVIDAILIALSVAAVVYASASAPWWVTVIAAGAAMTIAVEPVLIAFAAVAFGLGIYVGLRRQNMPEWRAVSVGTSMNVLAWAELDGFFGLTSIVAIAVGVFVFVLGIRRRPQPIRRRAWAVVSLVTGLAVLAVVGFGLGAVGARSDVESAQRRLESAISLLNDGEFVAAAEQFEAASDALRRADDRLSSPLAAGAAVVPVFSQHREFVVDLSGSGAALTEQVAQALREVDVDALRVSGGAVDVGAVAALEEPFAEIDAALDELATIVQSSDSSWLIPAFRDELSSLRDDIAENSPRIANLQAAARLAPRMLGSDGPRVYLVFFTTPAEARGLGGFAGNYAELTIDNGALRMTDFGRVSDLESQARDAVARITGPEGFLTRYGPFVSTTDGVAGQAPFRNLTMTPNFPWVGEVAAELYGQTTGRQIDGVIAMDPFVIQALLAYSGPIELTEVPFTLTADNAAQFILTDQYSVAQDRTVRIDALDEAGRRMFDALLAGALPDPATLARDLGPLTAEHRLVVWTTHEDEQDLLRRVGMLGELPLNDGADGWSVTVNNAGGNKIDTYLERGASYQSTFDPSTGETVGTIRVQLTNTAPTEGPPAYVIGNVVGLPPGTSRLWVSFYSPLPLVDATRDGEPTNVSPGRERDWNVYSQYVNIPSGATVSYELHFRGTLSQPNSLVTWIQPLTLPMQPL